MPTPRATYRLQLTEDQPFAAAAALVDYLADLGISHLYLSPVLTGRPGTRHFYDVADHTRVDPVLGGEEGLRHLADVAHAAGLGLIGDVVPNHMGTGPWNPLWDQLLREGRSSESARFFDVDWESPLPGAADKVILPVLASPYGDALAAGAFGLAEGPSGVRITYRRDAGVSPQTSAEKGRRRQPAELTYGELSFPLAAESAEAVERAGVDRLRGRAGEPRTWSRMHSLLEQQHYRLVSFRAGRRLVNYRRFFHVDDLAALRVEDEVVFEATHRLLLQLVADGVLDGLRVDHLDGLADPGGYLRRLRQGVGPDAWLVVEKLTTATEPLPAGWPVDGTTGYELLRTSLGLQVDPHGLRQLQALAADLEVLPDMRARWQDKAVQLDSQMGPDLRRLVRVVWDASQDEMSVRDVDYRTLLEAVSRVLVALPVYRTHVDPATGEADAADVEVVTSAVAMAREHPSRRRVPDVVWRWLTALLTGQVRWSAAAADAVTRFQQLSGPVTALGLEESLLLRHPVLLAACELGCDPDRVPVTIAEAHDVLAALPPRGMRTTATHDTRHGEDLRMRTAALAGLAAEWVPLADRLVAGTNVPDTALGLRLLQSVVGTWPITDDGAAPLEEVWDRPDLSDRLVAYAVQVARGQGVISSHEDPDAAAEADLSAWVRGLVDPAGLVCAELRPLAVRAAEVAMAASLSQSLLRITTRGVPDTFQGTERWDDSMLDPDHSRPVDFATLRAAQQSWADTPPDAAALWAARRDGRVKQWVVQQALRTGAAHPDVLGPVGAQEPVPTSGRWAAHLLAFRRTAGDRQVLAVCPRLLGRVTDGGRFPPLGRIWADTDLHLPEVADGAAWTDVLTGHTVEAAPTVPVADLLVDLPVALLTAPPPVG